MFSALFHWLIDFLSRYLFPLPYLFLIFLGPQAWKRIEKDALSIKIDKKVIVFIFVLCIIFLAVVLRSDLLK